VAVSVTVDVVVILDEGVETGALAQLALYLLTTCLVMLSVVLASQNMDAWHPASHTVCRPREHTHSVCCSSMMGAISDVKMPTLHFGVTTMAALETHVWQSAKGWPV
jgi:hypothetical protein